ncbi:MAG: type VI secretion system baseplate subunit TssK [Planctomycetaceae bacterium]|jgi:type VI secretion system protein ImpJ|nr:type VI secretion system baseplate subunit TssK [Planctomycetaceae bacterium]
MKTNWQPEYAVRWHEGMFLLPAHFQMTDRRNDFLLVQRFAAALPFAWGVIRQQLDVSQLGSGIFRVLEMEAVMPDGLYVRYSQPTPSEIFPAGQAEPILEIKLASLQEIPNTEQTIWLLVPFALSNPTDDFENLRYRELEYSLQDPSTEEYQPIPVLAPNLSLFLGDSPPSRFAALPIAKVSFRAEGFYLHDYEPPQLLIFRNSPIFKMLLDLVTTIRNRAAALIRLDEELPDNERSLYFDPRTILSGLLGPLPMLETLLFSEGVSPLHLFGALSGWTSSLCSIGRLTIPKRIDYDHSDPLRCFTLQVEAILREIELRIPTRYREIPFIRTEEEQFSLASKRFVSETLILGIAIRPGTEENKVIHWFEQAVIGFENEIESLTLRRSVGAARKQTHKTDLLALSRRMLFWEVTLPEIPSTEEPLCVVNITESERISCPAGIYLIFEEAES